MTSFPIAVTAWFALTATATYTQAAVPGTGLVFSISLEVPDLSSDSFFPEQKNFIGPLTAGRVAHWRVRYDNGRPAELSRRDYSGTYRPMVPRPYPAPSHGYLFFYSNRDTALPDTVVTPDGLAYYPDFNSGGRLTGITCTNAYHRRGVTWTRMKVAYTDHGAVSRVSFWHNGQPAVTPSLVHAKEFTYDSNGYLCSVHYVDAGSTLCNDIFGIARKEYRRGSRGEWHEIAFKNKNDKPTTDWHGVARYTFTYTNNNRISESALYAADGGPGTTSCGAHAFEWQYGSGGELIGSRAFDEKGTRIFDGAPLTPELLDKTWPAMVIEREQAEQAVPFWQLYDYNELTTALQRWRAYVSNSGYDSPIRIEQIRVLADMLIFSRARIAAIAASLLCRAAGLDDPRRIAGAILSTGVTPHPASPAAAYLTEEFARAVPSNAIFFTATETARFLSEYQYAQTNCLPGYIPVPLDSIGDLVYLDALRAITTSSIRLPDADELRTALREYSVILEKRFQRFGRGPTLSLDSRLLTLKGKESVAEIKELLQREIIKNNPAVRVFTEMIPGHTNSYDSVSPVGPVFTITAGRVSNTSWGTAASISHYWTTVTETLAAVPAAPDWREAARYLARAAETQAEWLWYHSMTTTAAAVYESALALYPEDPALYLSYSDMLISTKAYDSALAVLKRYPVSNHNGYPAHKLAATRDRIQRIVVLEKAVEQSGIVCTSTVIELAELYLEQKLPGPAVSLIDRYYHSCSNSVPALEWMVEFYSRLHKLEETAACLERLINIQPDSFDHWIRRAAVAFEMKQPERALECVRRAAELDRERLHRMITADTLLQDMLANGQSNLVRQLRQVIE